MTPPTSLLSRVKKRVAGWFSEEHSVPQRKKYTTQSLTMGNLVRSDTGRLEKRERRHKAEPLGIPSFDPSQEQQVRQGVEEILPEGKLTEKKVDPNSAEAEWLKTIGEEKITELHKKIDPLSGIEVFKLRLALGIKEAFLGGETLIPNVNNEIIRNLRIYSEIKKGTYEEIHEIGRLAGIKGRLDIEPWRLLKSTLMERPKFLEFTKPLKPEEVNHFCKALPYLNTILGLPKPTANQENPVLLWGQRIAKIEADIKNRSASSIADYYLSTKTNTGFSNERELLASIIKDLRKGDLEFTAKKVEVLISVVDKLDDAERTDFKIKAAAVIRDTYENDNLKECVIKGAVRVLKANQWKADFPQPSAKYAFDIIKYKPETFNFLVNEFLKHFAAASFIQRLLFKCSKRFGSLNRLANNIITEVFVYHQDFLCSASPLPEIFHIEDYQLKSLLTNIAQTIFMARKLQQIFSKGKPVSTDFESYEKAKAIIGSYNLINRAILSWFKLGQAAFQLSGCVLEFLETIQDEGHENKKNKYAVITMLSAGIERLKLDLTYIPIIAAALGIIGIKSEDHESEKRRILDEDKKTGYKRIATLQIIVQNVYGTSLKKDPRKNPKEALDEIIEEIKKKARFLAEQPTF